MQKNNTIFEAGAIRGWFTNVDLVQQLDDCYELFRQFHPDCDIVIAFDNSVTANRAKAKNYIRCQYSDTWRNT